MIVNTSEVEPQVLAVIHGKPMMEVPADLFIPPDALEILLDSFTGPLDLLLYLIRRQNIDILDIPMAHITNQYMQYIHLLEEHRLELAADYLLMAAMLAEIKSRLLLPPSASQSEQPEEDPRLALVRKLQLYEQFKEAAANLDDIPRCERDNFRVRLEANDIQTIIHHPDVPLSLVIDAMHDLIKRQGHHIHHQITKEPLSIRERMTMVLARLEQEKSISLTQLLTRAEGRMGLAVTLLAVLELARESLLLIFQTSAYGPIHIQASHYE
jgi:segregation and condensation protein A